VTSDPDFKVTTFFEVIKTMLYIVHKMKLYLTYRMVCLVTLIDI